jgi:TatD DNase family protein
MFALADAHCHLDAHHFAEGADAVIERALAGGVVGFLVVGLAGVGDPDQHGEGVRTGQGVSTEDALAPARFAVDLARRIPDHVAACVGLHPHEAREWTEPLHAGLRNLALAPEVVALGEIGLDYHYEHSLREQQRAVFARLVALARDIHKPIVIHTRSAAEDTLAILEAEGARDVGGIIHCFSEDRTFAQRALDLNFDLSFSGIVTFKNARSVQEVAGWAPLDRILVETDSPYLSPVPLRGQKCEPAHVIHTARRVAELRRMPMEEVARATLANTERRFTKLFGRSSRLS